MANHLELCGSKFYRISETLLMCSEMTSDLRDILDGDKPHQIGLEYEFCATGLCAVIDTAKARDFVRKCRVLRGHVPGEMEQVNDLEAWIASLDTIPILKGG